MNPSFPPPASREPASRDLIAQSGAPRAPLRGRRLRVTIGLGGAPFGALTRLGFLGGVFHGLTRAALFDAFGPRVGDGAEFRCLPPPAQLGATPSWLAPDGTLGFEVLWHDNAGHGVRAEDVADALQRVRVLSLGAERHRVQWVRAQIGPWLLPWPTDAQPESAIGLAGGIQINWLTPLHMASRMRVARGEGDRPPFLFRTLRSIERRAGELEPEWFAAWGFGSDGWVEQVEAVRRAEYPPPPDSSWMMPFVWRYGSRTKSGVVARRGLLGWQRFQVSPTPAVAALLSAGECFGVGEGSSFGCGHFSWERLSLQPPA